MLSQLYLPGALTVWCALLFGLAAFWGYSESLWLEARGGERAAAARERSLLFARRGYLFFALSVLLTTTVLLICLWRRDFRIEYVQQYSGLDLPMHYQVAAFWAGQKGSFLIWLLWGALLGLPLRRAAGRDEPTVMLVYMLTVFGLLFILVRENPFVMLLQTPRDGAGLNPLLQDDWMVIHPPIMFVGYAMGAIPFAFAVAALWRRDTSRWAARAFPWALAGFLVLGTAILMGGYWAYKTLGWGGYWGWDPVENASLIPWLLGIVLIHGLYLERTRGRYRRANLVVACLLYLSVLYGTFLTRSGVLADFSVHSFVDLGISGWLVTVMGCFVGLTVLALSRLRGVETKRNEDPFLSRGAFIMTATVVVALSAVLIAVGTSAPLLTKMLENPGQVGPEFYNRVNMPLALLMALLMAAVPFLTWRGTDPRVLARKLMPSTVAAGLALGAGIAVGVRQPFHAVFLFLAALALASNLHKVIEMTRQNGLARAGGYLAHVGVGLMFLGILASSAYDESAKVTLQQGEPQQVGDLTVTFHRYLPREGRLKERLEVEVVQANGDRFMAYPKLFLNDRTRQLMVNPDIRKTLMQDLYISPIQYEPGPPPGIDHRLQLAQGEAGSAGPLTVRFVGFDLEAMGDPAARLASGGPVEVGVRLEVTRDGNSRQVTTVYRFTPEGSVETPPASLPGGGMIALTGIDPAAGRVRLDVAGISAPPVPGRLSLDVTRKPLIKLVWYGLYVVLIGGALSTIYRLRGARKVDEIADATAAARAG